MESLLADSTKLIIIEWGLGLRLIPEKMLEKFLRGLLHFGSRTPTLGFIVCLVELNVLIPKKQKIISVSKSLKLIFIGDDKKNNLYMFTRMNKN